MKGLELAKKYYLEYGADAIFRAVGDYSKELAVGLVGSGSECYGFDDDVSVDHDFEPGFCIFVPDDVDSKTEFALERAYQKLPKEFLGYKRNVFTPAGGARHGVIKIGDFYRQKTGFPNGIPSDFDFLRIDDSFLAEAVNGEIFLDERGEFTKIRNSIKKLPDDALKKKIAGHLLLSSQAGQYNYERCLLHGETGSAQLAIFEFVSHSTSIFFLLNGEYKPFYKWCFRAMRSLSEYGDLVDSLEYLLSSENDAKSARTKSEIISDISDIIADGLRKRGLTDEYCSDLTKHARSVNDKISSPTIRNLDILFAV